MAVEYQAKQYLFARHPKVVILIGDLGSPNKKPEFIPNFAHDLESVVWLYLWFLHYRVPNISPDPERTPELLAETLSAVLESAQKFFMHGIEGHPERVLFWTAGDRFSLAQTFGEIIDRGLLLPYNLIDQLREEYTRIESQTPEVIDGTPRYPDDAFSDEIYAMFKNVLSATLEWIGKERTFPVEDRDDVQKRLMFELSSAAGPSGSANASGPRPQSAPSHVGSNGKRSSAVAGLGDQEESEKPRPAKKKRSAEQGQHLGYLL